MFIRESVFSRDAQNVKLFENIYYKYKLNLNTSHVKIYRLNF